MGSVPGGGGGAALNILTGMCEYGVPKQTHIEGVGQWERRGIMNFTIFNAIPIVNDICTHINNN